MIPILLNENDEEIADLGSAISCTVSQEINGIYELEMTYPVNGVNFDKITDRAKIKSIYEPNYLLADFFRIYKISRPISGIVTINAAHISYDLNFIPVMPFSATSISDALSKLPTYMTFNENFQFSTNISKNSNFQLEEPTSCRKVIEMLLNTYGGEVNWEAYSVTIFSRIGSNPSFDISYGKNMTDLLIENDSSDVITGVLPFWKQGENMVTSSIVWTQNPPFQKAIAVDFSSDFETQPTATDLQNAALNYLTANNAGVTPMSIDVSFIDISKMSGYEYLKDLVNLSLGDGVDVVDNRYGFYVTNARIVKTVTNVLLERYDSLEIGTIRQNFAQTIVDMQNEINNLR